MRNLERSALSAVLFAAAVLGPVPVRAEEDPYMLGRVSAVIGMATEVLDELGGVETVSRIQSDAPRSRYAELYDTVLELERLRARACDERRLSGAWCAGPFQASWLRVPGGFDPAEAEVERWIAEFAGPAFDLAYAVCELAPPPTEGLPRCSVE